MDNYIIYPKLFRNARIPIEKNRCFVLMPFSKDLDIVYGTIKDALSYNEFICNRADEIRGSKPIMNKILTEILKSQYIIADLTYLNPNVFYELGIAHTFKDATNILLIKQSGYKCPFDISHLTYIEYDISNLKLLTSVIIKFIEENNTSANFLEALHIRGLINIIHNNQDYFVEYIQSNFSKHISIISNLLNCQTKDLDCDELVILFKLFESKIRELVSQADYVTLSGILKVYYELILSAPTSITDYFVISILSDFFNGSSANERDIISWQMDLALLLAANGKKINIVMPWIIEYFTRTKSTTIDLNRYKLEKFLMMSEDASVNQIIIDAIFDKNCYIREHMADIIGEKKLHEASPYLVKQLNNEDNYYSAISIIEALGKLRFIQGIAVINKWIDSHIKEIISTKQFFVLKHARVALAKLDTSEDNSLIAEFDSKYSSYLKDYYIL